MSQLPLFFGLQLLGSWACVAVGPRNEWLCLAIGFLVGLALAVFLSLPLLLLGVFTAASVIAVLVLALAGAIGLAFRRGRATRVTVVRSLVWAAGFTALCVPFCAWDVSMQTYDSTVFIDYAVALQDMHQLTFETLSYLHSWGSFLIVAHALAVVTREGHLSALAPAFSISLLATLAAALHRGLGELGLSARTRTIAAVVAVAILLAVPMFRIHAVYIHANLPATGYLFVFAALFWLADVTADPGHLPVAFLGLLAFSFARIESPMFAVVFLAITLSQTRLSRSAVLVPYLGFTVVLASWLGLMTALVPADSEYMTPAKGLVMTVAVSAMFAAFLARDTRIANRLLPRIPQLVLASAVAGVIAIAALRIDVFSGSFSGWQQDLWSGAFWGFVLWPGFAILAVLSVRVEQPPASRSLRYCIALFFVLVALLTALGDDYRSGRFGSLTRITLHIVPVVVFYFALVFVPVIARRRSTPVREQRELA